MKSVTRNLQERPILSPATLRAIAEVARVTLGSEPGCVGFAFVNDAGMSAHHGMFSGDASTTDVLSFPDDSDDDETIGPDSGEPPYWGDVIICTDQAARQARELRHPYGLELAVLALHGLLHLLGYDHTRDRGEMHRLEEALRPRMVAAGRLRW